MTTTIKVKITCKTRENEPCKTTENKPDEKCLNVIEIRDQNEWLLLKRKKKLKKRPLPSLKIRRKSKNRVHHNKLIN